MNTLIIAFFLSLIAENNKCVNFSNTCNKEAIIELRELCPNVKTDLHDYILIDTKSQWIKSGNACLKNAPNNYYVKKYKDLFEVKTLD